MPDYIYTLCEQCDHFIEPNEIEDIADYGVAEYAHLDDGEKEHDHNASRSRWTNTLTGWRTSRTDLFLAHPDGKIGPNSRFHRFYQPKHNNRLIYIYTEDPLDYA